MPRKSRKRTRRKRGGDDLDSFDATQEGNFGKIGGRWLYFFKSRKKKRKRTKKKSKRRKKKTRKRRR